jgi:hypothetical protein
LKCRSERFDVLAPAGKQLADCGVVVEFEVADFRLQQT